MLQKLVMDVFAVGGEDRSSADQTAKDGERRLQNGQSERNNRDGNGNDCWGFLRALQSQSAEHESDEQAARVAEEDGRGIEVVAEEADDRASQRDGHHGDKIWPIQERHDEGHQSREQSGSSGKTVEAVN